MVIEGDQVYASERWLKLESDWLAGLSQPGDLRLSGNDNIWDQASSTWLV